MSTKRFHTIETALSGTRHHLTATTVIRGVIRRTKFGSVHEQDETVLYAKASKAWDLPLAECNVRSIEFDTPFKGWQTVTLKPTAADRLTF